MLNDAVNTIKGWLVAYAIVGVTAAILAWPILDKAATITLAAAFYVLVVAWLGSFVHLANSSVPRTWWWLTAAIILSFASPFAAVIIGDMRREATSLGMLAFAGIASSLAAYIAWRRKGRRHAV